MMRAMDRSALLAALLAAGLALTGAAAQAVQTFNGQGATGAFYTISAPDDWVPGDDLVIYNHGFDLGSVQVEPEIELDAYFLGRGYAVAASSYSLNGWALFRTLEDNRDLYATVRAELGEPGRVFVVGGSLGALVTIQALEQGGVGNVAGAYALCGPLGGSDVWDQALDLRLLYDLVCEGTNGELPGGAEGLPFTLDPEAFDGLAGDLTAAAVGGAIVACTGLGLPEALRSDGQRQRLATLEELSGLSEAFLPINLGYATVGLSDLVHDERKLARRAALGNAQVIYGEPVVDELIYRVAADPFDRLYLRRFYTPTGAVGDARVLVTHTDKDELVFPEHQHAYLQRIDPRSVVAATVIDDGPAHCAYTDAEVVAGFEVLEAWADGAPQPDAGAIQVRCEAIALQGSYEGPCRYDPSYTAAPLASRIRPRDVAEAPVDGAMTGSFFIAGQGGQGWFVEVLADQRAVVYGFTYDELGEPAWIGGTGTVVANGIAVDESWRGLGARFGDAFDPSDVRLESWGSLAFVFSERGAGEMAYAGPEAFGSGRRPVTQLTRIGAAACGAPFSDLSGLWYDPARVGEGLIFEVQADGRAFAAWFTYRPDGGQLWLYGEASAINAGAAIFELARFRGPRFGDGYDPGDLVRETWGTIAVEGDGDDLILAYRSELAGFGTGSLRLVRLTAPVAAGDCDAVDGGAASEPAP